MIRMSIACLDMFCCNLDNGRFVATCEDVYNLIPVEMVSLNMYESNGQTNLVFYLKSS